MTEQSREKYWQEQAGKMAAIANWALWTLIEHVKIGSDDWKQANDHLDEIQSSGLIEFDEDE